jgi:hypothetical protein
MCRGLNVRQLALCDVKFLERADNKKIYTDFRRVLERKDIDLVAIATPPHWHALISIAAAEAGKDVLCEKPMTRFIAEGRAVVNAFKRYNRVFQIGTFGRFGSSHNRGNINTHKIMRSGLLNPCTPDAVAARAPQFPPGLCRPCRKSTVPGRNDAAPYPKARRPRSPNIRDVCRRCAGGRTA